MYVDLPKPITAEIRSKLDEFGKDKGAQMIHNGDINVN